MEILALVIVGAIMGIVARLIMPGPDAIGMLGTVLVGIVGAIVGGYLWRAVFDNSAGPEWIGGILVAMAVLFVVKRLNFAGGRRSTL